MDVSSELTTLCWQLTSRQGVPQQSSKAIQPAAHSERPTTLRLVLTYRHGNWCCKLTTATNINLEWHKGASLHTLADDSLICTGWPENESEMKWRSNFCIMDAKRILDTAPEGTWFIGATHISNLSSLKQRSAGIRCGRCTSLWGGCGCQGAVPGPVHRS